MAVGQSVRKLYFENGSYINMWKLAEGLGSLKFTLAALILFGAAVFISYNGLVSVSWAISPPLFLLSANLAAAVITNPLFRKQTGLLVFHIALACLVIFAAISRLTYFKGHVEITEGVAFDHNTVVYESGPWHSLRLDSIRLINEGFSVNYDVGIRRDTYNRISWFDEKGAMHKQVIGDDHPFIDKGYRFYTTSNKGFAPIFTWYPERGSEPVTGSVHFPSYPAYDKEQTKVWKAPGGIEVMTKLLFDEVIIDPEKPSSFRLPEDKTVFVRVGGKSKKMKPGDSINFVEIPKGRLVYREMRTWMGYFIFNDWTAPWMLASCGVAVVGLLWHYIGTFSQVSWLDAKERGKDGAGV
jgi:cytochrome c biogenesis protein